MDFKIICKKNYHNISSVLYCKFISTQCSGYLLCHRRSAFEDNTVPSKSNVSQFWRTCTGSKLNPWFLWRVPIPKTCSAATQAGEKRLKKNPKKLAPIFNYSFHACFASTLAGCSANSWAVLWSCCFPVASAKHTQPIRADGQTHSPPSPPGFPSVSHRGE